MTNPTIGTSLFHALANASMARRSAEIGDLQAQISSGKKDPRPSADGVAAIRLSAANERSDALERYGANAARAESRLDQADIVLGQASDTLRRISELALTGLSNTASQSQRISIATEVRVLKSALLGSANARDETGEALFGGFSTAADPFVETPDGVAFVGDRGQPALRVSESMHLQTAVNGQDIFGTGTVDGAFEAIDSLIAQLEGGFGASDSATGDGALTLTLHAGREPEPWSLTLDGPSGTAQIDFTVAEDALGGVADAINAQTAATGITASYDPATGAIALSAGGQISVSGVVTEPASRDTRLTATDAEGNTQSVVSPTETSSAIIGRLNGALETVIDQRARAGAFAANAVQQGEAITERQTELASVISGLEDLDLADAITRLQEALLNRQAAQQTYAQITQQTLFDFIR
ncbi:MAG: flagellar hook-associated protein FlgL [Pseudomonadota bacterium]